MNYIKTTPHLELSFAFWSTVMRQFVDHMGNVGTNGTEKSIRARLGVIFCKVGAFCLHLHSIRLMTGLRTKQELVYAHEAYTHEQGKPFDFEHC